MSQPLTPKALKEQEQQLATAFRNTVQSGNPVLQTGILNHSQLNYTSPAIAQVTLSTLSNMYPSMELDYIEKTSASQLDRLFQKARSMARR